MSPIRVLLVDDNAPFLAAAATFLESLPRVEVVGRATCAADALSNIDALRPTLVLMDVVMPGMDGFQTTSLVKERVDAPKVVILSLHRTDAYRQRARAVGAEAFIAKDEFVAALPPLLGSLFPGSHP